MSLGGRVHLLRQELVEVHECFLIMTLPRQKRKERRKSHPHDARFV